jgi:hypothetical protein
MQNNLTISGQVAFDVDVTTPRVNMVTNDIDVWISLMNGFNFRVAAADALSVFNVASGATRSVSNAEFGNNTLPILTLSVNAVEVKAAGAAGTNWLYWFDGVAFSVCDQNLVQVVTTRQAAVADATGAGDIVAQFNALLARIRTHGLIAP